MKSRFLLIACFTIFATSSQFASAQPGVAPAGAGQANPPQGAAAAPPQQAAAGHKIAIVDVGLIFKKCAIFNKELEGMKGRVTTAEGTMKTEAENINKMKDRLKGLTANSQDYRTLETELARRQMDFSLARENYKRDFSEQESQLYYRLYLQIDDAVKRVAVYQGYSLVLRHITDPIKEDNQNTIMMGINKPIVYYNPSLDITPIVLDVLNREALPLTGPGPNNTARGPGAPGAR